MFRFIQEQESHSWHTVPVSRLGSHWPFVLFCSQQHIHTRCRARWCLRTKIQCSSSDCQQGQVGWRSALPCTIIHVVFSFLIFSIYNLNKNMHWNVHAVFRSPGNLCRQLCCQAMWKEQAAFWMCSCYFFYQVQSELFHT